MNRYRIGVLDLEFVEVLDRAVRTAFPDVGAGILAEVARWFWEEDRIAAGGADEGRRPDCAICVRGRATVCRRSGAGNAAGLCDFCWAAAVERFRAERRSDRRPPPPDHALTLAIRAVRAQAPAFTADVIADALTKHHAAARPRGVVVGVCLQCREMEIVIDSPRVHVCERCLLDWSGMGAAAG